MHRIDSLGNVGGLYTNGVPAITPATVADANAMNAIQEEIVNVILGAGITLNKADYTQLKTALNYLYGGLTTPNTWTEAQVFEQAVTHEGGVNFSSGASVEFNSAPAFKAGANLANSALIGSGTGSFAVDTAGMFSYIPARSEYAYVPGLMKEWTYGGHFPGTGETDPSFGANGADAWIGNSAGNGFYVTTLRAPKGATITGLDLLLSNSHGSATASVSAQLAAFTYRASGAGGGGSTQGFDTVITTAGAALTVPANQTTAAWTAVALSATPGTVPADGYLRLGVSFSNGALLGAAGVCRLYGVRLSYSINKVASTAG